MSYNIGIDLGTTFVAGAIAHPTQIEMFTLGDRSVVSPAVVYLREDGQLVTGEAAARRSVSNPDRVGREFKRRLGDPTPVLLGGVPHAVTALLGALLRDVLDKITETEGGKPGRVVLTHPANWGPFRRGLFEEVPHLAGLEDVTLITEPEAAAAHYAESRELGDGEIIAVYDLGGGTFDATVLCKRGHSVEILGTPEGIERLGGVDFDEAILSHVNYVSGDAISELDPRDPQTTVALARLRQDCVLAKEALSVDTEAVLPVFLPGRHFDVKITRAEFEDLIRAPIESTIGALSRTLRSAQVSSDELSAVLLVGGSSRIPLVAQMVSEELGRPTVVDTHPKYAVALGAATVAGKPPVEERGSRFPATAGPPVRGRSRRTAGAERDASKSSVAPSTRSSDRTSVRASVKSSDKAGKTATAAAPGARPVESPASAAGGQPPRVSGPLLSTAASPPAGLPPSAPPRGPDGGADEPRSWNWRKISLGALALAAAAAIAFGGVSVVDLLRGSNSAPPPAASGLGLPEPDEPATAEMAVAPSLPVPSLGTPIQVGATPGFVAVSPNGRLAYVANRTAGVVTVVDTSINRVIATIPIEAGPPQYVTFAPDGRTVYLSIFNEQRTIAQVGVLNVTNNKVEATIPVRTRPFLAAVTPDGKWLWVPNHDSGTVSVIDTATNQVTREISVPANPHWIEFSNDGRRAYTANHESNLIAAIDVPSGEVVARIPVGKSPHSLAVHPTRPLVANVNFDSNTVTMIDTDSETVIATIPVGRNPQEISWAPDGRHAYTANVSDGTVSVIDAEDNEVSATIPTGASPTSVGVLPDGSQAYVSNLNSGTLGVLNIGG